ncbi:MAG: DUF4474 domain-containing protein [Clostridia bacterium]|nr:DUF4474 domain-containing protein [Clostridia bacterium]
MKTLKRVIALILTLAIGFSVCAPSANAFVASPENFDEYREIIEDGGYPALSSKQFLEIVKVFNTAIRFLTGRGFIKQEHFNITADALLTEVCNSVANESGFDILMLVSRFPESKQYAEFVTETFQIDTTALREKFYELRYAEDAKGNVPMACVYYFLGLYFSVIEECHAYCEPLEGSESEYEVCLKIILKDGTFERVGTGVVINTETGMVTGKDGGSILGIGFEFSYTELLLYAQTNVWMRDFGFTFLYDLFCYTTPFFFYDTRRIKFDYEDKEWMIQVWKGNYLVSNGAEVGIYNREPGSFGTYYDCVDDSGMMNMSMELYHGDDLILERPEQLHWWLTGFKISDRLYPANKLTLDFTIKMQSEEMLDAFCEAVENHYRHDMEYTVDGLTVNVVW